MNLSKSFHHKIPLSNLIRLLITVFALTQLTSCTNIPFGPSPVKNPAIKHIVLVSIDGLRPDAINRSNAKNLFELSRSNLYYPEAQTIQRSVTLPSHTSMLTGLDYSRHKITTNKPLPGHVPFATVFQILKKTGKTNAAFFSKKKLGFLFHPDSLDYIYGPGQQDTKYHQTHANELSENFSHVWPKQFFNMTFIHIREPDETGHKYGWMSNEYLNQAIPAADKAIGQIYNTIKNSKHANDTLLIITADHGGKDKTHWYQRPEDFTIPWMAINPGIKPETKHGKGVYIYDTMPTILYLLGAPVPENIDGHVIPRLKQLFLKNTHH